MNKLIFSESACSQLNGRYVILDNDFLGILFNDQEVFADFLKCAKDGYLTIDPFVRLEFLREVWLPRQREIKENFVDDERIFLGMPSQHEIFQQIAENALALSFLYGHQGVTGASMVDLFLAARLVIHGESAILITGNKKDFPPTIFDTIGVINLEEKTGNMRAISVVKLNTEKLKESEENFNRIVES